MAVGKPRTKAADAWARALLGIARTHNARAADGRAPVFHKPFLGWCERWFAWRKGWTEQDETAYILGLLVLLAMHRNCRQGRTSTNLEGLAFDLLARAPRPGAREVGAVLDGGAWPPRLMLDIRRACTVWLRVDPHGRGWMVGEMAGDIWARHGNATDARRDWAQFVLVRSTLAGLGVDESGAALASGMQAFMDRTGPGVAWAAAAVGWGDGFCEMHEQGRGVLRDAGLGPRMAAWVVTCAWLDPEAFLYAGSQAPAAAATPLETLTACLGQAVSKWSLVDTRTFLAGMDEAAGWLDAWGRSSAPGSRRMASPGRARRSRLLREEARRLAQARVAAWRLADSLTAQQGAERRRA